MPAAAPPGRLLPVLAAWVVAPGIFLVARAAVRAAVSGSLPDLLAFVALPLAAWVASLKLLRQRLLAPLFPPSFLAAVITLHVLTYAVHLAREVAVANSVVFCTSATALVVTFARALRSDPGRLQKASAKQPHVELCKVDEDATHNNSKNSSELESLVAVESGQARQMTSSDCEAGLGPHLLADPGGAAEVTPQSLTGPTLSTSEHPPPQQWPSYQLQYYTPPTYCSVCQAPFKLRSWHCRKCEHCTERFDHHCPAIANCVGRRNHRLFLAMLASFACAQVSFASCSLDYLKKKHLVGVSAADRMFFGPVGDVEQLWLSFTHALISEPWLVSMTCFGLIQILWEVPLLIMHCYLVLVNLTTHEWVHWEKHPEFYTEGLPRPGRPFPLKTFKNPYNKGVLLNIRSFWDAE
eukprot:SM000009S23641  [mRNA]  locus=s9:1204783:1208396:+ [translate_table: standard]